MNYTSSTWGSTSTIDLLSEPTLPSSESGGEMAKAKSYGWWTRLRSCLPTKAATASFIKYPITVLSLPPETLLEIFSYLPSNEALSFSLVCAHWVAPAQAHLWSYIYTPSVCHTNRILWDPSCGAFGTKTLKVCGRTYFCTKTETETWAGKEMVDGNSGLDLERLITGLSGLREIVLDAVKDVDPLLLASRNTPASTDLQSLTFRAKVTFKPHDTPLPPFTFRLHTLSISSECPSLIAPLFASTASSFHLSLNLLRQQFNQPFTNKSSLISTYTTILEHLPLVSSSLTSLELPYVDNPLAEVLSGCTKLQNFTLHQSPPSRPELEPVLMAISCWQNGSYQDLGSFKGYCFLYVVVMVRKEPRISRKIAKREG